MINFRFFEHAEIETKSNTISEHIEKLIVKAKRNHCLAACNINDIIVIAAKDSDAKLLLRDQQRAQMELIPVRIVGPYPEKILSQEEQKKYETWHGLNH